MTARRAWLIFAFILGLATLAEAQTGGRMGGGSWGGSRSSSSSSYSSRSYSSSSSRSSSSSYGGSYSSSYSSSGGGGGGSFGIIVFLIGGVVVVGIIAMAMKQHSGGGESYDYSSVVDPYYPVDSADVSVLRIAVDGRARKFIQTELARIAKAADTSTEEGRLVMLHEVCLMLRRVRDAWVYGGAVNEPMRALGAAKVTFDKHVNDARARFTKETISNVQGQVTQSDGGQFTPRSDEGAGLILVSLIVAARSELFTVSQIGDGEDLRKALEAASNRAA
jgi:uncharacterized membrane protein